MKKNPAGDSTVHNGRLVSKKHERTISKRTMLETETFDGKLVSKHTERLEEV